MKLLRRVISVMLAVLMCIPSGIVSVAYAAEQEAPSGDYTVMLEQSEHGMAAFTATDESTLSVSAGDTVEILLAPDDGYTVDTMYLKDADSMKMIASKQTSDNMFSFTMPERNLVAGAEFAELEDVGTEKGEQPKNDAAYAEAEDIPLIDDEIDAALEELNKGSGVEIQSTRTTAYISRNVDEKSAKEAEAVSKEEGNGNGKEADVQAESDKAGLSPTNHEIMVSYHLVDTADKKLAKSGFEGDDFIASSSQKQQIYAMDGMDDCFVAFIDLGKMNGAADGAAATFSNSDKENPVIYDSISYDAKSGIAYIPKSLFFDQDGKEIVADLQAQVFAPYQMEEENTNVINVSITSKDGSIKPVAETQKISVPSFDVTVTFPLLEKDSADKFDMAKTDIYINDSVQPLEIASDEYFFNKKTGELTIAAIPMSVYSIRVEIHGESVAEKILKPFAVETNADVARQVRYPSDIKMIPDMYLDKNYDGLTVGHLDTEATAVTYQTTSAMPLTDKETVRKYFEYLCYSGNNYTNSLWAAQAVLNGEPLTSYLQSDFGDSTGASLTDEMLELYNYLFVLPGLKRSSTGETDQKLPLHSVMLFQGAGAEGGTGSTVAADLAARQLKQEVNIRTLGKNRVNGIAYGIFGFSVYNTNGTPAAYGIYKIPVNSPVGYIQIQKESANNSVTDGNSAYTFEGAQFKIMQGNTVVTDELTGEDTFTMDATGKTDTIAVPLVDGANTVTYTVHEVTAPNGYKINNQIYTVTVGVNSTASNPAIVTVSEEPYTYPSDIVINKYDKVTNYSEGDAALAGIQYEVLYYEGEGMDDFTSLSGLEPTRKWTIETKMVSGPAKLHDGSGNLSNGSTVALYGRAELSDDCLVRGKSDALYKDTSGKVILPLGTYVVREADADPGYSAKGEMYVMQDGVKEPNYSSNKQGTDNPSQGLLFMVKANIPDTKDYRNDRNQNGTLKVEQYATYKTTGYVGLAGNKRQTNIIDKDSAVTVTNKIKYGGLEIQKRDYNDQTKNPQGDANDMSSKFGVKNLSDHPVAIKSEHNIQICTWDASDSWTDEDGITWYVFEPVSENSDKYMFTFNTNYYGYWHSSDNLLPYGTYRVDEITAPTGYQRNGVVVKKFTIREDKQIASINIDDMIKRGTIFLVKFDAEDHTSTGQGSGVLQGTYTIKNKSAHYVWVLDNGIDNINIIRENADKEAGAVEVTGEGTWYKFAPEKDMFTFTTRKIGNLDAAWTTENPYLLSYGTYEIRETGTSDSYVISDMRGGRNKVTFSITENGQIVEFGTSNNGNIIVDDSAILTNPVARGGFHIQKNDADRKEHKNGNSASSRNPQGDGKFLNAAYKVTNKNEGYVWVKEDESISILVDNAASTKEIDGVSWYKFLNGQDMFTFKVDADGNYESLEDILPYGSYTITETTASEGYNATEIRTSIVEQDITISEEGQKIDKTYAKDDADNSYTGSFYEAVVRGGVKIDKNDADILAAEGNDIFSEIINKPQGDASLAGATYDIFNISQSYVWVDTNGNGEYEDNEFYAPADIDVSHAESITHEDVKDFTPVYTITTDEQGYAQAAADILPYGTYLIVENEPSEGYRNDTERSGVTAHVIEVREEGVVVDKTYKPEDGNIEDVFLESIIRGGFDFQKNDEETGTNKPLGGTDLHGTFSVTNVSESYVWIKEEPGIKLNLSAEDHYYDERTGYHYYGKNEVMFTFETDADTGKFSTSETLLPYGTYKITETLPPNGYLVESNRNPAFNKTVQIREDGVLADATKLIYNYAMRGDLFFEKKDATTGIKMTYIPFLITAFDKDGQPIESHVVYTDKNGSFGSSSDYTIHSFKTNKADETVSDLRLLSELVLSGDEDGTKELLQSGDYYSANAIKEFFENENYGMGLGVWFGVGTTPIDRERTSALPETGALPFGRYRLDELPCEANEGKALIHDNFTVTNESCRTTAENNPLRYQLGVQAAGNINFGTIYNWDAPLAPQMTTSAAVRASDTQYGSTDRVMVITDEVHYQGIAKNKDYTLVAMVADAVSGEYLRDATGDIAMATKHFNPNTTDGYERMEISVDTSGYEGRTVVVYETLYDEFGNIYVNHSNPDDEAQQIHFPDVSTSAVVEETNEQVSGAKDSVTVIDHVSYSNLSAGNAYLIRSYLIDAETGEVITDASGRRMESEQAFKPDAADGSFDVRFVFNASSLAGRKIVVCEEILENGYVISSHANKDDESQTVWIPGVATQVSDDMTGLQMTLGKESAVVTDTVSYEAVKPGLGYKVSGKIVDLETGREVASANADITPTRESGEVDLKYSFNSGEFAGRKLIAYAYMEYSGIRVATHEDNADEAEMIYVPGIATNARDGENGFKVSKADNQVTIIDEVSYEGLMPGYDYIVSGYLVDQNTGEPMEGSDGEIIASSTSFTAESKDGSIDIEFAFDGSKLAGRTAVVFESINVELENDVPLVAAHEDITDEDQTIHFPKLTSNATDRNNMEHITSPGESLLVDTVSYENVIPGMEYTMSGKVVIKETKEIIARAEVSFEPESDKGTVSIEFEADTSKLGGKTLVFVEELLYRGYSIAESNDMTDSGATVYVSSVKTSAVDGENGTHVSYADDSVTIVDTVSYKNLIPGKSYVMFGKVVDQDTGEVLKSYIIDQPAYYERGEMHEKWVCRGCKDEFTSRDLVLAHMEASGSCEDYTYELYYDKIFHEEEGHYGEVSAVKPFIASSANGTVVMEFNFDATGFEDRTVAVYEEIYMANEEGNVLTENFDCMQCGEHFGTKDEVEEHFRTSEAGCNTYSFYYTTEMFAVAEHKDRFDENQVIHIPELTHNEAKNPDENPAVAAASMFGLITVSNAETQASIPNGNHYVEAGKKCTVTNTVTYKNLVPGLSYTITGVLVDKATGSPTDIAAAYTFVPTQPYNDVELVYEFDSTDYAGRLLVSTETAYVNNTDVVATYNDLSDESKTIYVVKVDSDISDDNTNDNTASFGKTKITDTVTVDGLKPGAEYIGKGKLVDPETGEEYKNIPSEIKPIEGVEGIPDNSEDALTPAEPDADTNEEDEDEGVLETVIRAIARIFQPVTSNSTEFTAVSTTAVFEITYELDTQTMAGKSVVSYVEVIEKESDSIVGDHKDPDDEDQTIHVPALTSNKILDAYTGSKQAMLGKTAIADEFSYENLVPGKGYIAKATLSDADTGKALAVVEEPLEAGEANGTHQVTFYVDTTKVECRKLYVTEEIYLNDVKVAMHVSNADEDLIHIASIVTNAVSEDSDSQSVPVSGRTAVSDTVTYSGLIAGETYKVTGSFINTDTNEKIAVYDADAGEDAKAKEEITIEFVAEAADGSIKVPFSVRTEDMEGATLVGFESITYNDILVAEHKNPEDEDQTVYVPAVSREAYDKNTENHLVSLSNEAVLVDNVKAINLVKGKEYTMKAVLKDKETMEVVAETEETFTAEGRDVIVKWEVKFDSSAYAGKTLVLNDSLLINGVELVKGKDEEFYVGKASTAVRDFETGIRVAEYGADTKIIDTVSYENLVPGLKYDITGQILSKKTGKVICEKESSMTFEESSGTVDMEFEADLTPYEGMQVVATESISYKGTEVAKHSDMEDENQTLNIAKIGTEVFIDGQKEFAPNTSTTITDTVDYENIIPGIEYDIIGTVVDVATGQVIKCNGKSVTSTVSFMPENKNGRVDVNFTFDSTALDGRKLVVYEELRYNNKLLAKHEDINDAKQTVLIKEPDAGDSQNPGNSGDDSKDPSDTNNNGSSGNTNNNGSSGNTNNNGTGNGNKNQNTGSNNTNNSGQANNSGNKSDSTSTNKTNGTGGGSNSGSQSNSNGNSIVRKSSSNGNVESSTGSSVKTGDDYTAIIIVVTLSLGILVAGIIIMLSKKKK